MDTISTHKEGELVDHVEKALSEAEKLLEATGGAGLDEETKDTGRTSTGQHTRADDGYRGHKPSGVSRRQQKRAIKKAVLSANRQRRRQARQGITCSGPSEKAAARADG